MPGHLLALKRQLVDMRKLINREGSLTAFLIFGIGTEVLAVVGLLFLFRRRGWM